MGQSSGVQMVVPVGTEQGMLRHVVNNATESRDRGMWWLVLPERGRVCQGERRKFVLRRYN